MAIPVIPLLRLRNSSNATPATNKIKDAELAKAIFEKNFKLLPTKKGLIDGQLALIHNNDFSAEAVYSLNQKFGYDDQQN